MANPPRHNLPAELTSFVGREKEIKALKQLVLANQTRLVTVTGSGGTGKTRLALHMAKDLLYAFPDGIWLIDLAALTDPDLVPATVASILKQTESPNKSITQVLVDFLRSKRILLLLDNCEHLINAVASLVECILRDCPRASFLITSREILGASGEIPFRCPSLALPDANFFQQHAEIEPVPALIACESVRLFAERAALAAPGFALIETNVPVVAQVCRRLDGIPLAIELAAARTRILSLAQISDRLDHAFRLLTGGSRTALPRQQTLKATIDWSYNLLSPIERLLLLRLSIFFGGWTLEAAEAVCSDENIPPEEILDLLGRLVDKSLIQVEPVENLEPRYRMLETIRQYSRDRLLESGGDTAVRDRHLGYFLQFAEEAETHMRATGMTEWLKRAELDLDNLRLALEWSLWEQEKIK